jgi:hypothetical protein
VTSHLLMWVATLLMAHAVATPSASKVYFGTVAEIGLQLGEKWGTDDELREVEFAVMPKGATTSQIKLVLASMADASWVTNFMGQQTLAVTPSDVQTRRRNWRRGLPNSGMSLSPRLLDQPFDKPEAEMIADATKDLRQFWIPGQTYRRMTDVMLKLIGEETLRSLEPDRTYQFSNRPLPGEWPIVDATPLLEKLDRVELAVAREVKKRSVGVVAHPAFLDQRLDDQADRVVLTIAPGSSQRRVHQQVYGRSGRPLGLARTSYLQEPFLPVLALSELNLRPPLLSTLPVNDRVRAMLASFGTTTSKPCAMVVEPAYKARLWVYPPESSADIVKLFQSSQITKESRADWTVLRPLRFHPIPAFRLPAESRELTNRKVSTELDEIRISLLVHSLMGTNSYWYRTDRKAPIRSFTSSDRLSAVRFLASMDSTKWDKLITGETVPANSWQELDWLAQWLASSPTSLKWDRTVSPLFRFRGAAFPDGLPVDITVEMKPGNSYALSHSGVNNARRIEPWEYTFDRIVYAEKPTITMSAESVLLEDNRRYDIHAERTYLFKAKLGDSGASLTYELRTGQWHVAHRDRHTADFPIEVKQTFVRGIDAFIENGFSPPPD